VGYVVLGFGRDADAARARESLLAAGYDQDGIAQATGAKVQAVMEKMQPAVSILATMGTELEHQQFHLDAAKQGTASSLSTLRAKPRRGES
jgi:hypothetical protein